MKEYVLRVLLMGGGSISSRMSEADSVTEVDRWKAIFAVPVEQGRQTPSGVFMDDAAIDGRYVIAVERYEYVPPPDYIAAQREIADIVKRQINEGEDWR